MPTVRRRTSAPDETKSIAQESIHRCSQRHGPAIGKREAVGVDGKTRHAQNQRGDVRAHQERRPENRRSNGEVIFEVSGSRVELWFEPPCLVHAPLDEIGIPREVVLLKTEIVVNQQRACVSIVADPVAAQPRIAERQAEKKHDEQRLLADRPTTPASRKDHPSFLASNLCSGAHRRMERPGKKTSWRW